MPTIDRIQGYADELTAIRRDLHAHPEIGFEEVRTSGINWAFGPCVTVPQDVRWGRTYEGYSESPAV